MIVVDARADRRRDWALILAGGGAVTMTLYACACLFLLRENAGFTFYLACFAHVQILVALTGILGLLVKRELKISKNEINISDHELISRPEAETAVNEALAEVPAVKNDSTDKSS